MQPRPRGGRRLWRAARRQEAERSYLRRAVFLTGFLCHGQCRSCGAVHSRGAAFCWHCGAPLLEEARPSVLVPEAPAAV